jgi:hypothetical protein
LFGRKVAMLSSSEHGAPRATPPSVNSAPIAAPGEAQPDQEEQPHRPPNGRGPRLHWCHRLCRVPPPRSRSREPPVESPLLPTRWEEPPSGSPLISSTANRGRVARPLELGHPVVGWRNASRTAGRTRSAIWVATTSPRAGTSSLVTRAISNPFALIRSDRWRSSASRPMWDGPSTSITSFAGSIRQSTRRSSSSSQHSIRNWSREIRDPSFDHSRRSALVSSWDRRHLYLLLHFSAEFRRRP